MTSELLTPAEIAPMFRTSDKRIRLDYQNGIIPAARVDGKRFLFDPVAVREAYAEHAAAQVKPKKDKKKKP